jgi:predicted PurR-regulated permease PerM
LSVTVGASRPLPAPSSGPLLGLSGLVLGLVAMLALREAASLVVPVLFGLFFALATWPLVVALERRRVPASFALLVPILVVIALAVITGAVVAISIGELVVRVPQYEDRLVAQVDDVQELLAQYGLSLDAAAIISVISPERIAEFVRMLASAISGATMSVFVMAFTMIYALVGASSLQSRAQLAFGPQSALVRSFAQFGVDLRRYLIVRALLGLFAAVLAFLLLLVLRVPLPFLWTVLVFAASFVPNVGTIVALIPPMILAFLDNGAGAALLVVVGYALINIAQDSVLQPVVLGSELNLSTLSVFIAVIAWAWVLGVGGALLAVPLTIGLVELLEAAPSTQGLAGLLRNRPVPTAKQAAG